LHVQVSVPLTLMQPSPAWHVTPLHWHRSSTVHVPPAPLMWQRPPLPAQPHTVVVAPHLSPLPPPPCCVQSFLHEPHCVALFVCVSQPSSPNGAANWTQLSKPATHVEVHLPLSHDLLATLSPEQARPQPPQLLTSLETSASQPSSALGAAGEVQLSKPVAQVGVHRPALQLRAVTFAPEQARLHVPQ
jgi:hypothetical protein